MSRGAPDPQQESVVLILLNRNLDWLTGSKGGGFLFAKRDLNDFPLGSLFRCLSRGPGLWRYGFSSSRFSFEVRSQAQAAYSGLQVSPECVRTVISQVPVRPSLFSASLLLGLVCLGCP